MAAALLATSRTKPSGVCGARKPWLGAMPVLLMGCCLPSVRELKAMRDEGTEARDVTAGRAVCLRAAERWDACSERILHTGCLAMC